MFTASFLSGLLSLAQQFGTSSGLIIGAAIAILGWLAQRYFAFVTSKYESNQKAIQFAQIYQKLIQSSIDNYREEFTPASEKKTISEVKRKYLTKGRPAQILASTSSKDMQELIQKEAISLPIAITAPILEYYTSENLFDACYNLLGSNAFAAGDLKTRLSCVKDCHIESKRCIETGEKSIIELRNQVQRHKLNISVLLGSTAIFCIVCLWLGQLLAK
jgi:hypothetical protein